MNSSNIECFVRGIAVVLMLFTIVIDAKAGTVGRSTPTGFTDDFEAACAEAVKSNKKVLAVFSGSDWCHWCKVLEKDYLSKPEFVEEARKDFVLVFIDSPKDRSLLSDVAKVKNEKLVEKYKIRGFPAVKILKADGSEVDDDASPRNGRTPRKYVEQLRLADTPEGHFEKLTTEIGRDFAAVISRAQEKKYSAMLDLAGFIVEPLESVGVNYLPRCRALRAEIEKMRPDGAREVLLAKLAATANMLEKFQNRDVEGFVDLLVGKIKGGINWVDCNVGKGSSPLAISLVSACEFPSPEQDIYGIRLNLFGGTHHDVSGIDVGVLCNFVSNGVYGVQVGGLVNAVPHETWGVQFAGLVNIAGMEFTGMQAAGLLNIAGDVCGAQLSGLGNIGLRVDGLQISGGGNLAAIVKGCQIGGTGGNVALTVGGLQVSGVLNSAYRLRGLQCSAVANSGNILDGVQLSAINYASACCGVQIGAFNKCTDMAGLQIGIVNYVNTMAGCQIGICNVIKSSSVPILPVVNMSF